MEMSDKKLVCCDKCKYFKYQPISFIDTEHIEGERYETYGICPTWSEEKIAQVKKDHEIKPHELMIPSGCCSTQIQMCQHPSCFSIETTFLMGRPVQYKVRVSGQGQMNPYGECKRHKRRFFSLGRK